MHRYFHHPDNGQFMTMYTRDSSMDYQTIDQWDGGVGWLAYPDEDGRRASHAVVGDKGDVWVIDPIDAPGVDDLLTELGDSVAGVAVLSNYHTRDAGVIADRYDVPVSLPEWMGRVEERIDASIERYTENLGDSGFQVRRCSPIPGWEEAIAYRESDRTLYVADVLGTAPLYAVDDERIGVYLLARLFPPREMDDFVPERILVGHGTGIFEDAAAALTDATMKARQRFPKALMTSGGTQLHAVVAAIRDGAFK
jgi:hypothetical protein